MSGSEYEVDVGGLDSDEEDEFVRIRCADNKTVVDIPVDWLQSSKVFVTILEDDDFRRGDMTIESDYTSQTINTIHDILSINKGEPTEDGWLNKPLLGKDEKDSALYRSLKNKDYAFLERLSNKELKDFINATNQYGFEQLLNLGLASVASKIKGEKIEEYARILEGMKE